MLLATISPELNRKIQFLHQTSIKAESQKDLTAHSRGKPDRLLDHCPTCLRRHNDALPSLPTTRTHDREPAAGGPAIDCTTKRTTVE